MSKKIAPWIKGFLSAYSMRAVIGVALKAEWYSEKTEYYTSSVYELLGEYDFVFLLLWIACSVFFIYFAGKEMRHDKGICVLAALFAVFIPMGQVLKDLGSLAPLFGSFVNVIKTILSVIGFFLFFNETLAWITQYLQKKTFLGENEHFFSKKAFLKSFLILEAVYLLVVIINFPGNLCYDTEGQIMQVMGEAAYSTHHPLLSTFLVGLPVKFGTVVLGSANAGLFLYMIIQTVMFSAALGGTVAVLAKKGLSKQGLWTVQILYLITPIYSNIASTAVKDVPFISAFIGYFTCLVLLTDDSEKLYDKKFMAGFIGLQIATCLLRKNGYYVIGLTGILWCVFSLKKIGTKKFFRAILGMFVIGIVCANIVDSVWARALNANKGSTGEMFSLPFQITARYINDYYDELTDEEISAISGVLGNDMERIAERYNPELADAVKALYKTDASGSEISAYVQAWVKMFFKHPGVYFDGFFVHTYGWYCPNVSTSTRYETIEDDYMVPQGIWAITDKVLVFVYRFADRLSLLGVLQNAAFSVWCFWYLTYLQRKNKTIRLAGIPLWISFLICLIAPGFSEHTRYAFPILMTMPFFGSYTLMTFGRGEINEEA